MSSAGESFWLRLWLLYIFPPNRLILFLLGIGSLKIFFKFRESSEKGLNTTFASVLELLSILLILDFIFYGNLTNIIITSIAYAKVPLTKSSELFTNNYISSVIPAILLLITFSFGKGIFSKFLSNKIFVFLGEISFSIFILHQLFINFFLTKQKKYLIGIFGQTGSIFIAIILIIILSILAYTFIENPVRKKLKINTPRVS
jgi:peptidoglycan/LPS O-acetylase OafA/YrhL